MVSLQIANGTKCEVEKGFVTVNGRTVMLLEEMKQGYQLVIAYCMNIGETVRRISEGEYVVSL